VIDRPIEEVWRFITDVPNFPKWIPGVLEPKQTSAGPLGVGATGEFRGNMGTISVRVIEYEPNRIFSFEHTSGPLKGTTERSSVETIEGKTRFTRTADLKFSDSYKLVEPESSMRRTVEASLSNAKRILESEAKS
jgi:uncharacterized protein YndB with AHSA1/START domain